MTSVKLDTIHHIALQVADIAAAVEWYSANFQCKVQYQDETWALVEFANISVAFVLAEQHPYHIAITRDDITAYGTPKPHRDGTSSVYIRDPDGNAIEMLKLAD